MSADALIWSCLLISFSVPGFYAVQRSTVPLQWSVGRERATHASLVVLRVNQLRQHISAIRTVLAAIRVGAIHCLDGDCCRPIESMLPQHVKAQLARVGLPGTLFFPNGVFVFHQVRS